MRSTVAVHHPVAARPADAERLQWDANALQLDECMGRYALSRSAALRDRIFGDAAWLALRGARKFADRGEPADDLLQVASIGLLLAIDRFDPSRGVPFSGYATPTIMGELRRHFRDRTWTVHVPRREKDLRTAVAAATELLSRDLHRAPLVSEIAAQMGITVELVGSVLRANLAYRPTTLGPAETATDELGDEFAIVLDRSVLRALLAHLSPRERRILELRYLDGLSQSDIAVCIGISQVHVGRLIATSLLTLRAIADRRPAVRESSMN